MARRKLKNNMASLAALACVILALIPLVYILFEVVRTGAPALSWTFLTSRTAGTGGAGEGIGNAILGSLLLIFYASLIGIPIGLLTGVYVSEYGNNRIGYTIRFFNDVLANFPSIVVGLLAYALVVSLLKFGFSLFAGSVALAIIMIPIVSNTTEEALRMVPNSLREGSLALGVPRWRTVLKIILANGKSGVVTGVLLSIARIAGETAPLLLTAFYNSYWSTSLTEPVASLPLTIFRNYNSPSKVLLQQAWGAALVLILIVLSLNISVRVLLRNRIRRRKQTVNGNWMTRLSRKA
ncbi:MAG TPA: phosphate ABC transporter permease PstA [Thermoproteota archaeon]|nr:phosphate ABC transporter permease PstA [Thermoproteota archaeon]